MKCEECGKDVRGSHYERHMWGRHRIRAEHPGRWVKNLAEKVKDPTIPDEEIAALLSEGPLYFDVGELERTRGRRYD